MISVNTWKRLLTTANATPEGINTTPGNTIANPETTMGKAGKGYNYKYLFGGDRGEVPVYFWIVMAILLLIFLPKLK